MVRTVCHRTWHSCMNCPAPLVLSARAREGWHHPAGSHGCDRPRHYVPGCSS